MEKGWAEIPLAGCKQVKARKLESRISSIPQYLASRLLYPHSGEYATGHTRRIRIYS